MAVRTVTDEHGYFEGDPNCPYTNRTEDEIRPLMETSKELRVAAIRLLPSLIELIKKQAESALDSIELAKQFAADL